MFKGKNLLNVLALSILISNSAFSMSYADTDYTINRKIEIVLDSARDRQLSVLKSSVNSLNVQINGKSVSKNPDIYFRSNELMIPIKAIAQALDYDLRWIDSTKTAVLDDKAIAALATANDYYYSYGQMADIRLDTTPEIRNSRMYVPLDFLSEVLKARVEIENRTINISVDQKYANSVLKLSQIAKNYTKTLTDAGLFDIKPSIVHITDKTGFAIYRANMKKEDNTFMVLTSAAFDVKNGNTVPLTRAVITKDMDAFREKVTAYAKRFTDIPVKFDDTTSYYLKEKNGSIYFILLLQNSKGHYFELSMPYSDVSSMMQI